MSVASQDASGLQSREGGRIKLRREGATHTDFPMASTSTRSARRDAKGLRQFLDRDAQRTWIDGALIIEDAEERSDSTELRFRYASRFQKLLAMPQAGEVFDILALYARTCLPMPRRTERAYWSVSCLPSSSGRPLARVNASWMELFTLYADGDDIRCRAIVHLSDFTTDRSATPEHVDETLITSFVTQPEDISWFVPRGADIFGIGVRGVQSVREFLRCDQVLRAIRTFNLTHMNRGRNAYQVSHSYHVADRMLGD